MSTSNLNAPHFQDADKAREYLEAQVWPNGPICPHCGSVSHDHYKLQGKSNRPGLYKCKDCREPFTVTVGSLFEHSKIKLNIWLQAVFLLCSSKKGISAHQLHRMLGVTYKTAWFMSHRIREAMKDSSGFGFLGGNGRVVEADETFWGTDEGKQKRGGRGGGHKMKVMSLVERGGKVRSFKITDLTGATFHDALRTNIHPDTHLMTDDAWQYIRPGKMFAKHSTVNHSLKEYARGPVTTNTIEGFFSIFKRGLVGTYQQIGSQHLERYTAEFDFRYNHRVALGVNDTERTNEALRGISNKRLTYRRTEQAGEA